MSRADRRWSVEEAYAWCQKQASEHYENFPVASRLLPAEMRRHIAAIYAFARAADDMADEGEAPVEERLISLDLWHAKLDRAVDGDPEGPVFTALAETIREKKIPVRLLEDLLTAFGLDARNQGFATEQDLLDYCTCSANPVGRLVLHLYGYDSEENLQLSDKVCTGLQLANFWQDISIDLPRDRINVPRETMEAFGYSMEEFEEGIENEQFRGMMLYLTDMAQSFLQEGSRLLPRIPSLRLRMELKGTVLGGLRIVRKIRQLDYALHRERPSLGKGDIVAIVAGLFRR